jgi:hypothetical protein
VDRDRFEWWNGINAVSHQPKLSYGENVSGMERINCDFWYRWPSPAPFPWYWTDITEPVGKSAV